MTLWTRLHIAPCASCVRDRSCARNVGLGPTTLSSQRFSRSFAVGSFIWFLSLLPPPDVTRIARTCTTTVYGRSVENFTLLDITVRSCKRGHKIDLSDPSRILRRKNRTSVTLQLSAYQDFLSDNGFSVCLLVQF